MRLKIILKVNLANNNNNIKKIVKFNILYSGAIRDN